MTAQAEEILIYKGQEVLMDSLPLSDYLETREDLKFIADSSLCWRGYYGKWEILNDKLYLIEIQAFIGDYKEVDLNYLFPNQEKVFANWFTGEIRIPLGQMLEHVNQGFDSVYEKDLLLFFIEGILIDEKEVDNYNDYLLMKLEREEEQFKEKQRKEKKSFWKRLFGNHLFSSLK